MDRVSEGTRAKFNATFREKNCPLLTRAQFGFQGVTLRVLFSAAPAQSHLFPLLRRKAGTKPQYGFVTP